MDQEQLRRIKRDGISFKVICENYKTTRELKRLTEEYRRLIK